MGWSEFCVVSGGQTGVDRAALDCALKLGLECRGWCPKGRRAEDGPIPSRYPLAETPLEDYSQRTLWNVRDSDATLIVTHGDRLEGGTALTRRAATLLRKPILRVDLALSPKTEDCLDWLRQHRILELNVAGPRESQCPGIYRQANSYLCKLLRAWCRRT